MSTADSSEHNRADTGPAAAGIRVAGCAWPQVAERLSRGDTAVLPVGAAAKEHGYHLPLATDYLQAEWIAAQLAGRRPVVVWPTLSIGYYPVFVDYPGSLSLSRETFMRLCSEALDGIVRAGAGRVLIANTGISTIEPLESMLAGRNEAIALVNVYSGPRFGACVERVQEQAWGGHADEIETAIMLAIAPDLVDMSRARGNAAPIRRGLFNRRDPAAPNYTPSGVNGDPRAATAAKGEALVAALMEDVLAVLDAGSGDG